MAASRSQISGYFRQELESSLEAEISMSNLPLYNIFWRQKEKKTAILEWNDLFKFSWTVLSKLFAEHTKHHYDAVGRNSEQEHPFSLLRRGLFVL